MKGSDTMNISNLISLYGIKAVSEELNIPRRTVENWYYGISTPPVYVVTLINEHYKLKEGE